MKGGILLRDGESDGGERWIRTGRKRERAPLKRDPVEEEEARAAKKTKDEDRKSVV